MSFKIHCFRDYYLPASLSALSDYAAHKILQKCILIHIDAITVTH